MIITQASVGAGQSPGAHAEAARQSPGCLQVFNFRWHYGRSNSHGPPSAPCAETSTPADGGDCSSRFRSAQRSRCEELPPPPQRWQSRSSRDSRSRGWPRAALPVILGRGGARPAPHGNLDSPPAAGRKNRPRLGMWPPPEATIDSVYKVIHLIFFIGELCFR